MDKQIRFSARGIAYKDSKLIIAKHKKEGKEYYVLPGGRVESYESPEETVVREFKEETGLDVKTGRLAYYKVLVNGDYYGLDLLFECVVVGGKLEINDPDKKVEEVKFVDNSELNELVFYPKQLLGHLFKEQKKEVVFLGMFEYPE